MRAGAAGGRPAGRMGDPRAPRRNDPWITCPCGHLLLLHDIDGDDWNPLCCVDGCDQKGCSSLNPDSFRS